MQSSNHHAGDTVIKGSSKAAGDLYSIHIHISELMLWLHRSKFMDVKRVPKNTNFSSFSSC